VRKSARIDSEVVLELMVLLSQDGDPDPELGQPPHVGEEPEPSTAVLVEIRSLVPLVPAVSDDAERVPCRRALSGHDFSSGSRRHRVARLAAPG
jgi:hypothetical protein